MTAPIPTGAPAPAAQEARRRPHIERDFVVDDVRWANDAAELQIWPDFFTSYHDKNGGGDRVVTDGALHVLDLNEVVPGSDSGLSLELAHLADLEAPQ